MANEQPDELVILIHGTFAGDKERRDEGDRWWQRGSSTWQALTATLPKGTSLPSGRLIHWSGDNTQSQRLSASMDLLVRLIDLERRGIRYHLVGHSHGGSVIWEALVSAQVMATQKEIADPIWARLTERAPSKVTPTGNPMETAMSIKLNAQWAEEQKRKRMLPEFLSLIRLPGLRSVTTVGTPFLRFLPEPPAFLPFQGWHSPRFSLAAVGSSRRNSIIASLMVLAALASIFGSLLLVPLAALHGIPVWIVPVPLLLLLVTIAAGERLDLADSLTVRERAWRQVFARFSDRWLGLWAPTDEAIRVLQTVAVPQEQAPDYVWLCTPHTAREPKRYRKAKRDLKLPVRLNPKMSKLDGFVPATHAGRTFARVGAALRIPFNKVVGPWISRTASNTLHGSVQGNDMFNTALVYASPWPLPLADLPPGLPDDLAERLDRHADEQAARLGPEIRDLVASAALADLPLAEFREWLKMRKLPVDRALLHTGYFDDPDVLALISLHIERHMAKPPRSGKARAAASPKLTAWLDQNAVEVAARLADFRTRVPD
ncbi:MULTISPECIES: hypothetical protein [unclassified Streptomyces]|uniref:hypothetical protein n=1 Tax=unclassified Streptomyces TaxID=2593676 RepID=UPI0004CC6258|nr:MULTISPECIES: hypothetical protein [unclassified Streptomyces]KOV96518.1 hypothetical protein ADL02_08350 [Streptomyces sp. NRRL WC-3723]